MQLIWLLGFRSARSRQFLAMESRVLEEDEGGKNEVTLISEIYQKQRKLLKMNRR